MYCSIENNENRSRCRNLCCELYNVALGLLSAVILFLIGLVIGASFSTALADAVPLLIAAAVIIFIIFIVTLLTKGCCRIRNNSD